MIVQSVDYALGVCIPRSNYVTSLLLRLVTHLREAPFKARIGTVKTCLHTKSEVAKALLHRGDGILLSELIFIPHSLNELLSLAAAVFDSLNDIAVTHIHGVDNSLSRETNLASNLLNSRLNIASTFLKCVEVNL